MKKRINNYLLLLALIGGMIYTPLISHAEEKTEKSNLIASEDEKAASERVGEEGMIPVYGTDIKDGTYLVEAETSSSMFRIVKAEITVANGDITAVITLGGKGYLKLYMGTGEEAVNAEESDYAAFIEDAEGGYTYQVPVSALNQELECTGFSKKKEKWYDHQILFRADTLPADALLKSITPIPMDVEDGNYTMEVTLAGGSGKTSVLSPAPVTVFEGSGTVTIEWSSPNYDYMIVNGEKLFPVNTEGNSVFEIPVWSLDAGIPVIADTVAMGTPHEIEYTLTFHSDTLESETVKWIAVIAISVAVVCVIGAVTFVLVRKKRKSLHD